MSVRFVISSLSGLEDGGQLRSGEDRGQRLGRSGERDTDVY